MRKSISFIAIATLVGSASSMAQAYSARSQQEQAPQTVVKKRTMIYDERSNELTEVEPPAAEAVPVTPAPAPVAGQSPIYILNNQKYQGYQGTNAQAEARVQDQPTTVVQDSPLKTSPADGMRKKRQETEGATEDGIVQALEKARMDDEVRRRDRFNNAIGSGEAPPAPVQIQQVQQVVPAEPQTVIEIPERKRTKVKIREEEEEVSTVKDEAKEEKKEDKVDIKNEIRSALNEAKEESKPKYQMYFGGLLGMGKYPDVVNVRGDVSAGAAVGVVTPERVVGEASFIYGSYQIEDVNQTYDPNNAVLVDMKQYSLGMALKYQLLPGRLRPTVGAAGEYVRRQKSINGLEFQTSDAFDAGLTAGLDMQLTDNFGIGFDFRYMWNIGYRQNNEFGGNQSFTYGRQQVQIEELSYYTAMLSGKLMF